MRQRTIFYRWTATVLVLMVVAGCAEATGDAPAESPTESSAPSKNSGIMVAGLDTDSPKALDIILNTPWQGEYAHEGRLTSLEAYKRQCLTNLALDHPSLTPIPQPVTPLPEPSAPLNYINYVYFYTNLENSIMTRFEEALIGFVGSEVDLPHETDRPEYRDLVVKMNHPYTVEELVTGDETAQAAVSWLTRMGIPVRVDYHPNKVNELTACNVQQLVEANWSSQDRSPDNPLYQVEIRAILHDVYAWNTDVTCLADRSKTQLLVAIDAPSGGADNASREQAAIDYVTSLIQPPDTFDVHAVVIRPDTLITAVYPTNYWGIWFGQHDQPC